MRNENAKILNDLPVITQQVRSTFWSAMKLPKAELGNVVWELRRPLGIMQPVWRAAQKARRPSSGRACDACRGRPAPSALLGGEWRPQCVTLQILLLCRSPLNYCSECTVLCGTLAVPNKHVLPCRATPTLIHFCVGLFSNSESRPWPAAQTC